MKWELITIPSLHPFPTFLPFHYDNYWSFQLVRCWLVFINLEWIVLFSPRALIRIENLWILCKKSRYYNYRNGREGKEGREGMEGGNCYQFSFQLIRCWLLFIIVEWIVLFSSCALIRIANTDIIIIVNKGRKVRKDGKVRKGREWRERLRAFDVKAAYTKGNAVYFEVKSVLYCMSRK